MQSASFPGHDLNFAEFVCLLVLHSRIEPDTEFHTFRSVLVQLKKLSVCLLYECLSRGVLGFGLSKV